MKRNRRRVPGPFTRLARSPQRLGAVVLLCVTALAAAGVQSSAAVVLKSTIDDSWRGDYDILVTAGDALPAIGGKLPPNALGGGADGLAIDDWQRVLAVSDVEVAAPLGHVLVPGLQFASANVVIPAAIVEAADAPQAYRVTSTYTTDDGLGERIVQQQSQPVIFDPVGPEAAQEETILACMSESITFGAGASYYDIDPQKYPVLARSICAGPTGGASVTTYDGDGGWGMSTLSAGEQTIPYSIAAPRVATRIDLVDPAAERALLGEKGAFLDPLVELDPDSDLRLPELGEWAKGRGGELASQITSAVAQQQQQMWWPNQSEDVLADLRRLFADNGDDFDLSVAATAIESRYVPLLISDADIAALTLRVEVEAFGPVKSFGDSTYALPTDLTDTDAGEPVGTAVADVSPLLNPFHDRQVGLAWPGTDALAQWNPHAQGFFAQHIPSEAAGGTPLSYTESSQGIVLDSRGFVPAIPDPSIDYVNSVPLSEDGTIPGSESAYVIPTLTPSSATVDQNAPVSTAVPVGTFDPRAIGVDEAAVSHVPLGLYASARAEVADGSHSGVTMQPSLSGLGIVATNTTALASIRSATLWKDTHPIDSIRVRVQGIDAYTPEARSRVIEVAQAIERLGYTAKIMAGASPTDVDVLVDGYAFGTDDIAVPQQVGELGTVSQRWSELGAAARVDSSVSTASLTMLGIALAAGIMLLAATQIATIPARRQQSVVFRELGITRARTARWFAAEELPALIVVPAVAVVAWLLSGRSMVAAMTSGVAIVALVAASLFAVIGPSRTQQRKVRDHRSRRRGARSVTIFGLRQALIHPVTTIAHAAAILIIAFAAASLTQAILESRAAAGQSNLAQLVTAQLLVPQIALGAVGVVGGFLLARIVRGMDLARRGDQWATLRAAGWTSSQVARAQRAEGVTIAIPAVLIAAATVFGCALWLDWTTPWLAVGVAVIAGTLSTLTSFTIRVRGTAL